MRKLQDTVLTDLHASQLGRMLLNKASVVFTYHLANADRHRISQLFSARVKGCSGDMLRQKRPLKQAVPLTSDSVYFLDSLMQTLENNQSKVILGHLLFCMCSCARFGDRVYLDDTVFDKQGHDVLSRNCIKQVQDRCP